MSVLKKVGNTSVSQVNIPNFFYNRDIQSMRTFDTPQENRRYFKENLLFKKLKDINLSNYRRNDEKKFELYNKQKLRPVQKLAEIKYEFPGLEKDDNPRVSNSFQNTKNLQSVDYNNENNKAAFSNSIIDLIKNINNGDVKIEMTKKLPSETVNKLKQTAKNFRSVDFEKLRTKVNIDFCFDKNEDSRANFKQTLNNKFNFLTKKTESFPKNFAQNYYDSLTKKTFIKPIQEKITMNKDINLKQRESNISNFQKTKVVRNENPMRISEIKTNQVEIELKHKTSSVIQDKEEGFYQFNSLLNKSIFSQNLNSSDFSLPQLENKVYFK